MSKRSRVDLPQPSEHSCTPAMTLLCRRIQGSLKSATHVQWQSPLASDAAKICAESRFHGRSPGSRGWRFHSCYPRSEQPKVDYLINEEVLVMKPVSKFLNFVSDRLLHL